MNIVFGLCGQGRRFQKAGYVLPKYLLCYHGAPMIYHSVETLKIPGRIYFVVLVEHLQKYSYLERMLMSIGDEIIPCYEHTQGAAETLLKARPYIQDHSLPFVSANCDQYLDWSPNEFINNINDNPDISYILTYKETSDKCSYIRQSQGFVVEVREKQVISNEATVGVYHWAKTGDFFKDAEAMISSGIKEAGEYFVAPVYNWSISRGLQVKNYSLNEKEFWPVGTPEDLHNFVINSPNIS
jgi:dTDP-glucose pyrophosphorylase